MMFEDIPDKSNLGRLLKERYPNSTFEQKTFEMKHDEYGDIKLEIFIDKQGIIKRIMTDLLLNDNLSASYWKDVISAELSPHSKLRVRAIRRLNPNKNET